MNCLVLIGPAVIISARSLRFVMMPGGTEPFATFSWVMSPAWTSSGPVVPLAMSALATYASTNDAFSWARLSAPDAYMYTSGADKRAQENASFVDAYVANADIAKGTTGPELVQAGLITQEKVAKGSVPPGIITNLNDLAEMMTAGPISTKQFITGGSFVSAKDGGGGLF